MTSEDVKDLISALDRQTKALDSIAKSLEKSANPPLPKDSVEVIHVLPKEKP